MPTNYFDFKKFRVYHDKCAMKVGTDGVLLGAWTALGNGKNILDLGCGSGLISLMMAQRSSKANIVALDIDEGAVEQSLINTLNSAWKKRIQVVRSDISQYTPPTRFDCIVCNPPFYEEDLLSPDARRSQARHTQSLPFSLLIQNVVRLLTPRTSSFSVIIPTVAVSNFEFLCWQHDLYLHRRTDVVTKQGKAPKRSLLEFRFDELQTTLQPLILTNADGKPSDDYVELTRDFYLDF